MLCLKLLYLKLLRVVCSSIFPMYFASQKATWFPSWLPICECAHESNTHCLLGSYVVLTAVLTKSLSSIFSIKAMGYVFLLCRNVYHFYIPNFSFYRIILNLKNEVELLFNVYDAYVGNETPPLRDTHFAP